MGETTRELVICVVVVRFVTSTVITVVDGFLHLLRDPLLNAFCEGFMVFEKWSHPQDSELVPATSSCRFQTRETTNVQRRLDVYWHS